MTKLDSRTDSENLVAALQLASNYFKMVVPDLQESEAEADCKNPLYVYQEIQKALIGKEVTYSTKLIHKLYACVRSLRYKLLMARLYKGYGNDGPVNDVATKILLDNSELVTDETLSSGLLDPNFR